MKTWDYMYVYGREEGQWTEVECYEQPWWCVLRAALYHKYICMRTNNYLADLRCFDYANARRKTVHKLKLKDGVELD